jgi:AcrR family transcriptional regulator
MSQVRLTREETRALTRSRLLDAAAEVFAEKGFGGAAVDEIAERAGYTRGAFYSNFADKDDLFLTLFDQRLSEGIADVGRIVNEAGTPGDLLRGLRNRESRRPPDGTWFLLLTEFRLYALRNRDVRKKLAERERKERRALGKAIAQQFAAIGLVPPADPEQLALILQCLEHGIELEQLIDPRGVPRGSFLDALALLFDAGAALARERRR